VSGLHALARLCDRINAGVGHAVAWITLLVVLIQFTIVVMRYVFGVGSLSMQQSVVYLHGALFMMAAGYALLDDAHVRIDIFYAKLSARRRALINLLGTVCLLMPVCAVIAIQAWPYVLASWRAFEGAPEGVGLQAIFVLKTALLIYPALLAIQGLSLAIRSLSEILGLPRGDGAAD
jgi:TRAP-type mannitol/chloroaromatic compound transport system permease small subunit